MAGPIPYLLFPGNAAEALARYREIFGGDLETHSFQEFGRADGPPDSVAHGTLAGGSVTVFAADAGADEDALQMAGMFLALLGAGDADTTRGWWDALSRGARILDPLQEREWGAWDGQLVDEFGVRWLLGWEG
ncbi:VOC family protein [Leucobacter sp. CSA2]|uniref:VOC family protein n=1 Tax=Leucobacter edaphi TaxID=2796472 RepID=A0A934QD08_9MICO|nr:VOC family protein [Leucobacter edaphi]MBK0420924.1 VOC family protein [Leucobacter edaphi]